MEQSQGKRKLSILVVDDDEQFREYLFELLEGEGHHVFVACDGSEALMIFNVQQLDLMLVDLVMPRCDGIEFVSHIREKDTEIPIITFSGTNMPYLQACLKSTTLLGAQVSLVKPFPKEVLLGHIEALT